jgi:hypothetical protein
LLELRGVSVLFPVQGVCANTISLCGASVASRELKLVESRRAIEDPVVLLKAEALRV